MSAPMLQIKSLRVCYGAIEALHGIDMEVPRGHIVTLLGANGAGKTTTLRAISGLVGCSAGDILFEGKSIVGLPPHRIVEMGVAHVPEGRGIFANLSVQENLLLGAYSHPRSRVDLQDDIAQALDLFPHLRERRQQNAGTLSGGELQMLAIARALLAKPRLLLLDEPSLGLAPQVVQTIFAIIQRINQAGATILLVEQNVHMALAVAHDGCLLEVGAVAMRGSARELAGSDAIQRAYLGVV